MFLIVEVLFLDKSLIMGWYNYLLRLGQFFLGDQITFALSHTKTHCGLLRIYRRKACTTSYIYPDNYQLQCSPSSQSECKGEREKEKDAYLFRICYVLLYMYLYYIPLKELLHQSTYWCIKLSF